MKKLLIPLAGTVIALSGCTSYRIDNETHAVVTPKYKDGPIYATKWTAGTNRVTATSKAGVWFGFWGCGEGKYAPVPGFMGFSIFPTKRAMNVSKQGATYNACVNNGADALVGAMYKYKVKNYFCVYHSVECTVAAYPAMMDGVEFIKDKPVAIRNDYNVIRIKPYENVEPIKFPGVLK